LKNASAVLLLFGLTLGLSAALLFAIQPMYAKMLLPLVGGAPAVWSAVVVFFQVALLVGYLFAHLLRSVVPIRAQVLIQLAIAALAAASLPFRILGVGADASTHPIAFVLTALCIGAGVPFFVIATTSPLLQSWFSRIGHRQSGDPYFLYSASNAGSLLGLAIYPLLLEPMFGVRLQTRIWEGAYLLLIVCLAACGAVTWRLAKTIDRVEPAAVERIGWRRGLRWIALAFVPASLSLAITTQITNDVAPIPLLWTLPLGIYLLTFIIAFARRPLVTPEKTARAVPYGIIAIVFLALLSASLPAALDVAIDLAALFLIAMTCHGELAASRPDASNLTKFYVLLSVGGALGGLFNGIVAPNVFHTIAEFPLTIILACSLLPAFGVLGGSIKDRVIDLAAPVLLGGALLALYGLTHHVMAVSLVLIVGFGLSMVACFAFVGRRLRFALGIAAVFIVAGVLPMQNGYRLNAANDVFYRLDAVRDFFGTKLVVVDSHSGWHELVHSGTVHGIENMDAGQREIPLSYYSADGPLGAIFGVMHDGHHRTKTVGIVGLGIGSAACYHRAGEQWTFIEIDPQVIAIARDNALFSYLDSCTPDATFIQGDGRLELTKVPPSSYDMLMLDAYSSDQPPVHMLTREAFALYMRDVAPRGLIAFHVSNRYFNLAPVLANLSAEAGWLAWIDRDVRLTDKRVRKGEVGSVWVIVAKNQRDVGEIASDPRWSRLPADPKLRTWTDDYSSVLSVIHP
jgi:spermidine synthase